MAKDDIRIGDRVAARIKIKLKYPDVDTFIQRYSANVSRGGIFIATRNPKPVGTWVHFEFQLERGEPLIRGEGEIVWIKPFDPVCPERPHGVGVRFHRLDPASRAVVDRAISWCEARRRREVEEEATLDDEPTGRVPLSVGEVALMDAPAGDSGEVAPTAAAHLEPVRAPVLSPPVTPTFDATSGADDPLLADENLERCWGVAPEQVAACRERVRRRLPATDEAALEELCRSAAK